MSIRKFVGLKIEIGSGSMRFFTDLILKLDPVGLTIIFFILVLPIGFMRRLLGKDPMQLQKWKKDQTSAFKTREHVYTAKDIEHPY